MVVVMVDERRWVSGWRWLGGWWVVGEQWCRTQYSRAYLAEVEASLVLCQAAGRHDLGVRNGAGRGRVRVRVSVSVCELGRVA